MAKQLRTRVHVDGTVYGPGDVVPPEVAAKITNPDAWEPETEPARTAAPAQAPTGRRGRKQT